MKYVQDLTAGGEQENCFPKISRNKTSFEKLPFLFDFRKMHRGFVLKSFSAGRVSQNTRNDAWNVP